MINLILFNMYLYITYYVLGAKLSAGVSVVKVTDLSDMKLQV